jgi:hypothetical protein
VNIEDPRMREIHYDSRNPIKDHNFIPRKKQDAYLDFHELNNTPAPNYSRHVSSVSQTSPQENNFNFVVRKNEP